MAETPNSGETAETAKRDELVVSIWSKAVETQMHFNEMSAKSRQLGLTFVAAALGVAIFLFTRGGADTKYTFDKVIAGRTFSIHVAEFLILAAALAVYAVKLLDLGVYHKMLRGAVAFGEDLEENHLRKFLGLNKGMTQAISHFSRHNDASVDPAADGKYAYAGTKRRNAGTKINAFYWTVIAFLVLSALGMFAMTNNFF